MKQSSKAGPITIKGIYRGIKRDAAEGDDVPSLKSVARSVIKAGPAAWPEYAVQDAKRWLEAKRPGGTDQERADRRAKRKEQQAMRSLKGKAKAGALKPSGKGKKKGD